MQCRASEVSGCVGVGISASVDVRSVSVLARQNMLTSSSNTENIRFLTCSSQTTESASTYVSEDEEIVHPSRSPVYFSGDRKDACRNLKPQFAITDFSARVPQGFKTPPKQGWFADLDPKVVENLRLVHGLRASHA